VIARGGSGVVIASQSGHRLPPLSLEQIVQGQGDGVAVREDPHRTTTVPLNMFMPHAKASDRAGSAGTVIDTG
jgi:hypothetical protein